MTAVTEKPKKGKRQTRKHSQQNNRDYKGIGLLWKGRNYRRNHNEGGKLETARSNAVEHVLSHSASVF